VRTYYIAAEDVSWNYAPRGSDPVFSRSLPYPWGERTVFPKQRYIGYTDQRFSRRAEEPVWQGILGPTLRAVVGDTLKVVLLNRTTIPVSIHPHGVRYTEADEGARYGDRHGDGDAVPPGGRYEYTWFVVPQSGPVAGEPSSKVWLYHSHVGRDGGASRGLVGVIIVTDPAHATAAATPDDVDREFVTLWMIFDEGNGHESAGSNEANLMHTINGLIFGNLHGLLMNQGDRVRWYLVDLGSESDWHTPHWHGETVLVDGHYTDVVALGPATMVVADMVAENPGEWLLHCHVSDHMMSGMYATYTVLRKPVSSR
jgi:FtsP/CotA-like multicopper oxidase with cupredoxin domain